MEEEKVIKFLQWLRMQVPKDCVSIKDDEEELAYDSLDYAVGCIIKCNMYEKYLLPTKRIETAYDVNATIALMNKYFANITPEKARILLFNAGIIGQDGQLTEPYRLK